MIGDTESDDKGRDENKPRGLYLLFIVISFLVIVLTKPTVYKDAVEREVQAGLHILGTDKWASVNGRTGTMFNAVIVDSGFKKYFIDKVNRNTNDEFPIAKKITKLNMYAAQLTDNIQIILYQVLHRANYFYEWLWLFVPFILAQIASGYYYWKIQSYSFGNATRTRALLVKKILKLVFVSTLFYFLIPGVWIGIMPFMPVVSLFLLGWLTKRQIISYQKVI